MHPLLHSPFLQALGYAIINSLWQFALLWLLYFAINTLFKLSSHQKYTTGIVLEFAGFVWFLETLHFYYNQSLLFVQTVSINDLVNFQAVQNSDETIKEKFFLLLLRSEQFFPYLSIAYLALLFVLAIRWLYAYTHTQKVRTEGLKEIETDWHAFVQKLSVQLGIKRTVHIFLSQIVQTPLTIGFIKPLILIPVATINYLTPQQLEAVILHELAHIKRFDYLFNLLLAFVEACLFFNPFMQLIHQQIKKERENCCDDWVIKYKYNAASYAQALLQIASHQTQKPLLALQATENKRLLINRIKRIIEKNERSFFNYQHQLLALLVMTVVLSSLSFLSPSKTKKLSGRSNARFQKNIVFEPIAAKVDNPLFNPVFFLTNSAKLEPEAKKKTEQTKTVKTTIRINRLPAPPPEPFIASDPDLVIAENDNVIEQPATFADLEPVRSGNNSTISKNNVSDVDRYIHPRQAPGNSKSLSSVSETTERHFKRFEWRSVKESKDAFAKAGMQLKKALDEIKSAKEQEELVRLQEVVRTGIRRMQQEKTDGTGSNALNFKIDQLALLEKQIEKAIDSMQLPNFFTAALNPDLNNLNINLQLPAIVYTFPPEEKPHTFSYEYFTAPQIKIIKAPVASRCSNAKNKREKIAAAAEEEIKQNEVAPPPARPSKVRAVYVIKI